MNKSDQLLEWIERYLDVQETQSKIYMNEQGIANDRKQYFEGSLNAFLDVKEMIRVHKEYLA